MSERKKKNKALPFIVWTLQRTGGTNLTQRLLEQSGLPATEHEPFNLGRLYGDVTKNWMDTKNESALVEAMIQITKHHGIIKHCVEMVPWEISEALADAAIQQGYQHLFLYRKNARDRLLSLHFARETGVWGPRMKKNADMDAAADQAIPVDNLIRHERKCVKSMQKIWHHLVSHGAHPLALSYEDFYQVLPEQSAQALLPILKAVGLSRTEKQNHNFVQEILGRGDQGTRDKYESLLGVDDLERALSDVPCFDPTIDAVVLDIENEELPDWVLRAQIDIMPHSLSPGQIFDLGGVVVLAENAPAGLSLQLYSKDVEINLNWSKPSPRMARLYPNNHQSANARFKTDEIRISLTEKLVIYLKDKSGERYNLFNISIAN